MTTRRAYCNEPCEHGGVCTLEDAHHGDHEAWGTSKMMCSWPRTVDDEDGAR